MAEVRDRVRVEGVVAEVPVDRHDHRVGVQQQLLGLAEQFVASVPVGRRLAFGHEGVEFGVAVGGLLPSSASVPKMSYRKLSYVG